METIVLASSSPRRKELMSLLDIPFQVMVEETEEIIDATKKPFENVMEIAYQKARAVAIQHRDRLVIGCDTIVVLEEQILGKPKSVEDAKRMLQQLSGRTHQVLTGVSIVCEEKGLKESFYECTEVSMKSLEDWEIDKYIATKEPLDKAGAYGIQGKAAPFISGIKGDYFNVVGLPVHRIYETIQNIAKGESVQ